MKKKWIGILAAVAIVSIAAAGIGKASAYFTTYTEVKGARTIHLGDETTITEEFEDWTKIVQINNSSSSSNAVYVRVKALAGQKYPLEYYDPDENWEMNEDDGMWYFGGVDSTTPIEPGKSTTPLEVYIGNASSEDEFNVVVVYETTPAIPNGTNEDGSIKYEPADWSRNVTSQQ